MTAPQDAARPLLAEVLVWCAGIAYVVLLPLLVSGAGPEATGLRLLPAALLAVLLVPLALRRPLPALALLVAVSFVVTLRADSAMAAGQHLLGGPYPVSGPLPVDGALSGGGMPLVPVLPETQAWQIASVQAVLTDLAVGWIAAGTRPWRTTVAAALAALGAQLVGAGFYREGRSAFLATSVLLVLMAVTAWTVGHSVRERRRHTAELRTRAAEQAVVAERLRIARELHDMVAHSIGVIAIQAGVGRRVIDTQPAEARNSLAAIEDTSRDTLAGLRRMLGALRAADRADGAPLGPAPGLAALDALVRRTRDAGVRVDVEWRGERQTLPAEIELSGYRIVQEALTNVVRHSGAPACRVTLDYGKDGLAIEITDEGRGLPGPAGSPKLPGAAGYGLTGMRERAALLHGEFTAGPLVEGGFRVAARLPLPAAVA
ncbi:two-component system sensor kinase [Streptomyces laurentii]|uniref:histidine kinase n=1 Tax=Streptomyces laurentii TaxID=39478 RepID=A0A161JGI6_STRLU|nr:two-component system sensor kinase [Streptomyces laurentii]